MKLIFFSVMVIVTANLFAAPLEGGYALAPRASASADEKALAYINARSRVIEAAKKYLGTPYRFGGMNASGLDCSGFVGLAFRDALGVSLPRSASGLYSWAVSTPIDRAQPGDFLFFRTNTTGNITHVALYLGNRRFIHSASSGSQTGVIYSSLNERYWANAFAGAGRAFPEVPPGFNFNINDNTSVTGTGTGTGSTSPASTNTNDRVSNTSDMDAMNRINRPETFAKNNSRFSFGIAVAPTWRGFTNDGQMIRGVTSQIGIYSETYFFGRQMIFGFEIRPEYDGLTNIFRLPMTVSWGLNERYRVFLGPVLTLGDTSYPETINWLGVVGISVAPFAVRTPGGNFAPYLELAWQHDFNNPYLSPSRSFTEGLRFSTGVRWLMFIN
jgi:probable lipoprotein NlpC